MARPRLPDADRRDDRLPNLRVTAAERVQVEERAAAAGLPLVEFCRRAIFRKRVVPPMPKADAATLAELNRIGVNLNQIARHANRGEKLPPELSGTLASLRNVIERIASDGS